MLFTLARRFLQRFGRKFAATLLEKKFDRFVAVGAILYFLAHGVLTEQWDAIAPLLLGVCLVLAYHAFEASYQVSRDIDAEIGAAAGVKESPILTVAGRPATVEVAVHYPRLLRFRLYSLAATVTLLCGGIAGLVLRKPSSRTVQRSLPAYLQERGGGRGGRADLQLRFSGRDRLQFLYVNDSNESADRPKRFFGLWDLSNPFYYSHIPGMPQPLPLVARVENDFVFHNTSMGPNDVLDNESAARHVQKGDRLFGTAEVWCSNCEREHAYWVFFEVGVGGWYSQMAGSPAGKQITIPKETASRSDQEATLNAVVPIERRIAIAP